MNLDSRDNQTGPFPRIGNTNARVERCPGKAWQWTVEHWESGLWGSKNLISFLSPNFDFGTGLEYSLMSIGLHPSVWTYWSQLCKVTRGISCSFIHGAWTAARYAAINFVKSNGKEISILARTSSGKKSITFSKIYSLAIANNFKKRFTLLQYCLPLPRCGTLRGTPSGTPLGQPRRSLKKCLDFDMTSLAPPPITEYRLWIPKHQRTWKQPRQYEAGSNWVQ